MDDRTSNLCELAIIKSLQAKNGTVTTLAKETGYHYYTVRRVISDLEFRGLIKFAGYHNRSRVFKFNRDPDAPKYTIPTLTNHSSKEEVSAFRLVNSVYERRNARALKAVENLPVYITRIFISAFKFSQGQEHKKNAIALNLIRKEMEADFDTLKNTFYLYQQVLNNPRFWDKDFLINMPDDPNFNVDDLIKAYEEVYGPDSLQLDIPTDPVANNPFEDVL